MDFRPEQLRGWANTAELMGPDITANTIALYRSFAAKIEECKRLRHILRDLVAATDEESEDGVMAVADAARAALKEPQ